MCGILGVMAFSGIQTDPAAFSRALLRMAQRGPDDSGEWRDRHVWFGHRRLAIIDPTSAGHQPMVSADGRYIMVFNGAIYNHLELRAALGDQFAWRGTCDTETLLAAFQRWGTQCLPRLIGMFAFAVWDRHEQTLTMARDRMGIKPLYYGWHNQQLIFASRPTAAATLLPSEQRDYDPQALRSYLECGFIPAPYSLYRSLKKLPAAHYMVCDHRGSRLARYWDYRHIAPQARTCVAEDLVDELQGVIDTSVRARMLSDVPLGIYLSSGVDSSVIAASMARISSASRKAFTISFAEPRFDEGPMAERIARHLGLELVTERLGAEQLLAALPEYLRVVDEPLADSAGVATMVLSKMARRQITVAVSGDGGDELFCGYPHHLRAQRLASVIRWPKHYRHAISVLLNQLPWHNGKLLAGAMKMPDEATLFHYIRSISKNYPELLLPDVLRNTSSSMEQFEQSAAGMALDLTPAELGSRLDMAFTLPDLYLQKWDMATMAYSIEGRSPFMDHRVVEWAMRLPLKYKLQGSESKALLKKLLCRSLPCELVYRPKQGFSVPIGNWLKTSLKEWAMDALHDESLTSRLPIDWVKVRTLYNQQLSGSRSTYPLVWAALMLLSFVREHEQLDAVPATLRHVA